MFGLIFYFIQDLSSAQYLSISIHNNKLVYLNHRVEQTYLDKSKPDPVTDLTDRLVKGVIDDVEKTYLIYKWITDNISYDVDTLSKKIVRVSTPSPLKVVTTLKSQCDGYAQLFYTMAKRASLNAEIISGTAGDIRSSDGHAWNVIKINGVWYMLDATWDAGSVTVDFQFIKRSGQFSYFLPKPEHIFKTHKINDPKWKFSFSGVPNQINEFVKRNIKGFIFKISGIDTFMFESKINYISISILFLVGFIFSLGFLTLIRYE